MKGILIQMAPKRVLPSAVPGGGGGGGNERLGSLLGTLVPCLFKEAFSNANFEPSACILEPWGTYVGSLWYAFLKLLPL